MAIGSVETTSHFKALSLVMDIFLLSLHVTSLSLPFTGTVNTYGMWVKDSLTRLFTSASA